MWDFQVDCKQVLGPILILWQLGGDRIEYVNPYIPTQTPGEDLSDHMQSPGWQPTLCVA